MTGEYTLSLTTPHGDVYRIHEGGWIQRMDQPSFVASPSWRMIGIVRVTGGPYIPLERLTPETISAIEWTYKNGNPRYTVVDLDHGTRRQWGNTKYHGIRRLEVRWSASPSDNSRPGSAR